MSLILLTFQTTFAFFTRLGVCQHATNVDECNVCVDLLTGIRDLISLSRSALSSPSSSYWRGRRAKGREERRECKHENIEIICYRLGSEEEREMKRKKPLDSFLRRLVRQEQDRPGWFQNGGSPLVHLTSGYRNHNTQLTKYRRVTHTGPM